MPLASRLAPQGHGTRFVHGVVVEVAHYNHAHVGVDAPQAVGNLLAQLGGGDAVGLALLLSAQARWPVVYDDGNALAKELAYDAHLVAGGEGHGGEGVVGHVFELEISRVVHQAHVDAAFVGRVVMHDLQVPCLDFGLVCDVFHHRAVFNLAHADYRGAYGRCLGLELRYGVGEVVYLEPVFAAVPLSRTFGGELLVAAQWVVGDSVEEVFEVVKGNAGDLHAAAAVVLGCCGRCGDGCEERYDGQYESLVHNIDV